MKKMKSLLGGLAASIGLALCTSGAFAQTPVTDAAAITMQEKSWAAQAAQMVKSLEHYSTQIENQQKQIQHQLEQINAVTGNLKQGDLLSGIVRQQLPDGFLENADNLRKLGAGGASSEAQKIYQAIKSYGCDQRFSGEGSTEQRKSCEASALAVPENIALLNQSVKAAQQRQESLKAFVGAINQTQTAKDAQDLANRLTLELAYLNNERQLMDLAMRQMEQQRQLTAQQNTEQGAVRLKTGGAGKNPLSGGL